MPHAVHEAIFRSQPEEHAFEITNVEGTIPLDLSGTFLRNGPGLYEIGEEQLNFFDAHALIAGVTFDAGKARFRSRHVRTPLLAKERAANALVQRRIFTNKRARWSNFFALDFGNGAMHDVYAWGDGEHARVIAGHDLGHFALDARTLATNGPETWGGAVTKGHETSPMPYCDPESGHLVGWIKKAGGMSPDALSFVELDGAFRVVTQTPFHRLDASPVIVHDQRATAKWYVATEQALRLSPASALWGAKTVYESIASPPGATATILLVSRDGGEKLLRIPLPAPIEIAFHVINAYDDGARVVVDLVTYGGRIGFEAAAPKALRDRQRRAQSHGPAPTPMRFVVDPATSRVVESRQLGDVPGDAPEIADALMGQRYRYAYFPTVSADDDVPDRGGYFYFGSLAKLDVDSGTSEIHRSAPGSVLSPAAFVPRPSRESEDDGWLLSYALRDDGASVLILDAKALARGPVCTLELGVHLPGVSHTRWASGLHLAVLALVLFAGAMLATTPASAQPHALDSLPPGHWMIISNNMLQDVDPCPARTCSYSGAEGQPGLVNDWVGGAFADGYGALGSLVLWGGGHGGYWGSEVYAFDIETGLWSRLSEPYADGNACDSSTGQYPDGSPCPAHTYDAIEYHPGTNSLVPLASETNHMGGYYDNTPKLFDLGARAWRRGCARPDSMGITGASSAYDATRDLIWFLGAYNQHFASYDVDTCTWTNYEQYGLDIDLVSAIDPMRDLFVTIDGRGTQTIVVHDLASPSTPPVTITSTGDDEPQHGGQHGFEWDPVTHHFVAWVDGPSVYVLTPPAGDWRTETWTWSRVDPAATNTVVPTPANDNGTYGRFRYVPSKNVFIVFNHANEPVFAYRLSPDIPPPRQRPDAGVPTGTDAGPATPTDAGSASGLDAGAVARDGSTVVPPPTTDADGGCGCRAASPRRELSLAWLAAALVLGGCAVRIRSRRGR